MPIHETTAFEGATSENFAQYYDTVRGYVREKVTQATLSDYVHGSSLHILDIGGGEGRDAVWLAESGHHVRLIDPSEEMIAKATKRAHAAGVASLVRAEAGDPADLLHENDLFDVVLSHGVLMYLRNPVQHLRLLRDHAAADGIVSVLTKGKAGFLQWLYTNEKIDEALRLEATGRMVNSLERDVLAVDDVSMLQMLGSAGLQLEDWSGVRIVSDTDYRNWREVPAEQLAGIVSLETRLGHDPNIRGMGQMLHFICSREEN